MARLVLACALISCLDIAAVAAADFARDVQPILHARCAACHGSASPQGNLSVLTRAGLLTGGLTGPAIEPGSSQRSLLIQRISGSAKGLRMPLNAQPLNENEIQVLTRWIDEGASWDPSSPVAGRTVPLALSRPKIPLGSSANPIDRFLEAYLQSRGQRLPDVVSAEVFVRRAFLDIWGLPPTPEQRQSFLLDKRPDKRNRLIERLLANRANYAEHWMSYWNDLLHNDEGVRYSAGSRESIGDWLFNALSTNLAYDQMVKALLNPSGKDAPKGYLVGISWGGDASASQSPPMQAAQNSAQVFLGANLKCASCHDSFVSRWKLRQAFGLAAFFSEKPLEVVRCDVKTGDHAAPQFLFPELGDIRPAPSLEERRAQVAELFTASANGRFSRTMVNRVWKQLFGFGLVENADDMDLPSWNPDLLDWLAADFVDHGYDLQYLLHRIMTSHAYQLPAPALRQTAKSPFVFAGPLHRRLSAEQFLDAVSCVTGEWKVLDDAKGNPGVYARNWRLKADPLARALGRPDRRQVVTERSADPTTIQALELVNGEELSSMLHRGAKRMLGQLPPAPENLFDSGVVTSGKAAVDIDITSASTIRLVNVDAVSWGPEHVVSGWLDAEFLGPDGPVKLTGLALPPGAEKRLLQIKGEKPKEALSATGPAEFIFDVAGKGYTRFRATVGLDESSLRYEVGGKARFFVFTKQPDPKQMIRVSGPTPVEWKQPDHDPAQLVTTIYRHALSRDPTLLERTEGVQMLKEFGADGLEDLLWIVFLSPEFQFIR